jgi:MoaA/NifB/PqqE/SkfB family radical SAM enzyme
LGSGKEVYLKKNFWRTGIEGFRRLFYLIPSQPEVAQIEVTNRCNFNCAMCQRIPLKVPIKDMDFGLYKKVLDKLGPIKEMTLTGWGEPLFHPKIVEMVKYAKKKGKWVSLTSNGSLLTESLSRKLVDAGLDSISISIDDIKAPKTGSMVHPITNQIKNIERFIKMKKKSKSELIIQATLHKGKEKKIFEIIKWASRIGADMVNLNRLDLRFNKRLKRPDLAQEKKLVKKLDELGEKYKIRTEFAPHIAFSGISRKAYRFLAPFMHRGGRHCLRVYNYVYINLAGKVTPCCALPLWSVGDLLKGDLRDIWRSEKFKKFRQHDYQRKICGKCDVLEVKQYA